MKSPLSVLDANQIASNKEKPDSHSSILHGTHSLVLLYLGIKSRIDRNFTTMWTVFIAVNTSIAIS
jgi:hypothetical protein